MPIIWPVSLPDKPLLEGYQEQPPNVALRTQMDAGPPKQRKRFTAGIRPFTMRLSCTKAQVATFDTFWITTTAGGTLAFEWTHPRTGATVNFRFVGNKPPRYTSLADDLWVIAFDVEIMP